MRVFAVLIALLLAACQTTEDRGGGANILIMGEDANPDTVPRGSRVFSQVLDALANELIDEGFDVYDETAVTLDDFAQGRRRRTDAEVIDIARSIQRPPIDVAVIFAIHAHAQTLNQSRGYTDKVHIRIEGRLLNVRSGRRLGNFEVELPRPANVAPHCEDQCRLEAVGRNAQTLARDLGAVLAQKLDGQTARAQPDRSRNRTGDRAGLSTAFTLTFVGFSPGEMTEIEEFITSLSGYEHYRPIQTSLRTNSYWYETSITTARLNRNLRLMLKDMDLAGRVSFGGGQFRVEKISRRKQRS